MANGAQIDGAADEQELWGEFDNPFANLPPYTYVESKSEEIATRIITTFEAAHLADTGEALILGRADRRRLVLRTISDALSKARAAADRGAKKTMLRWAYGQALDEIGRFHSERGKRLEPKRASVMVRFWRSNLLTSSAIAIPAGTTVAAMGGDELTFTVPDQTILAPGLDHIDIRCIALEFGPRFNDLLPGQVNQLIHFNSVSIDRVENIDKSGGGRGVWDGKQWLGEDDEHYRYRLYLLPPSWSVAGPRNKYKFWIYTADPEIVDAAVWSDEDHAGEVHCHPLMRGGELPDEEILQRVRDILDPDEVVPLTDWVFVKPPETVLFDLNFEYSILESRRWQSVDLKAQIEQAAYDFAFWQRQRLGRPITPSEFVARVNQAGAVDLSMSGPGGWLQFTPIKKYEVAIATNIQATFKGFVE